MKNTWRSLNDRLPTLSEDEVMGMLNNERQTLKRVSVLERMHQRYNTLRVARERLELLKEAKLP